MLCSNLIQPVTRTELCSLLDPSLFLDNMHRVVFEEICVIGPVPANKLRELLPGRITNRGFPDFELREFLGAELASEAEIEELFASVLGLIEQRHGEDEAGMAN
jgi:hypothetical protein